MALRSAVGGLFSRRAVGVAVAKRTIQSRAFMSTSSEIFAAPAFPVKSATGFEGTDPAVWLEKYQKPDPAAMWAVGSFPVQQSMAPVGAIIGAEEAAADGELVASEDLWDTAGMLSALTEPVSLGGALGVDEVLDEMDRVYGYYADSVLKKRRKKMNKHKHRKRKKALRMRTKKN